MAATIYPLSKDAFDVHDVDYTATDFPNLNWIVEHCGLARLDDFMNRRFTGRAVLVP